MTTGVSFAHLRRLSDSTGLFEHARGAVPRREHGYCLDDVGRGLLVICREREPDADLIALAETYLAFIAHAQNVDGAFHNRLGYDRLWHDEPGVGDWWGRALWGLGTAAVGGPTPWIRSAARTLFDRSAALRSPWLRSNTFAALGAAQVLAADPRHQGARDLLADTAKLIGPRRADLSWPWPEQRLCYADAAVAEVLIAAGRLLDEEQLLDDGLVLLGWLLDEQTRDGHLSVTPAGGRARDWTGPGFDQQPIEAAALADACARAFAVTGADRWEAGLTSAVNWFLGANDSGIPLADQHTGGCCDGLERDGRNENQGAESTIALISTLQHLSE